MANLLAGARLRLRDRLGALPPRGRGRHGRLRHLGLRAQRRGDLAALLRDARRGGAQRPVRHPRPPRPRQDVGRRAAAARGRPAPLLRARARGIAESGIAVEVSTAGLRKRVGEIYPAPAFLEMCLEAGAPVALSSDAHVPEDVGVDYDRALELLGVAGRQRALRCSSAARGGWSRSGRMSMLSGIGYDSHRLVAGRPAGARRRRARARARASTVTPTPTCSRTP